jgi:hypothetical protein
MIQKSAADSTIESIHRVRREISEKFKGDINAIVADAEQRAKCTERPVWNPTTQADGRNAG